MVQRITDGGLPGHGVAKGVKRSKNESTSRLMLLILLYYQRLHLSFCCSGFIKSVCRFVCRITKNKYTTWIEEIHKEQAQDRAERNSHLIQSLDNHLISEIV